MDKSKHRFSFECFIEMYSTDLATAIETLERRLTAVGCKLDSISSGSNMDTGEKWKEAQLLTLVKKVTIPAVQKTSKRPPIIKGNFAEVILTKGFVAIIDTEDVDLVSKFTWHAAVSHQKYPPYASTTIYRPQKVRLPLHRLILNAPTDAMVDHINGDTLDNRKQNLRLATCSDNQKNTFKIRGTTSGYKGVSWGNKEKKWKAQIRLNKVQCQVGGFPEEIEAAIAYDIAALRYFGDFARTNFSQDELVSHLQDRPHLVWLHSIDVACKRRSTRALADALRKGE